MPNRAKQVKMCGMPKFLPGGLLAGGLALLFAAAASVTARAVTVGGSDNSPAQSAAAARFSPAVADILKMVDAKVDTEVIKSFIKSAPIHYHLTASEIIALKEHGLSNDLLLALVQHGGEAQPQASQPAASPPPAAYGPPAAYQDYSYGYPAYPYDYPYSYYNYSYSYGWPGWYWPSVYLSFSPFCNFYRYPFCSYRYPYSYFHYPYGSSWHFYPHSGFHHSVAAPHHFATPRASGFSGRPMTFAGHSGGGFRPSGTGGHSMAFASHGGGFRGGGGSGGRSSGRH